MPNFYAKGLAVFREMLPGVLPDDDADVTWTDRSDFAPELMNIGVENIFGKLWSRKGLSRRDRSLVTLGILIAMRSEHEMESHFRIALQNGLTKDELAEVIYHASGYAGFPAANTAKDAAVRAFNLSWVKPLSALEFRFSGC